MLLNLRELKAFKAIVEHGSMGRAAEALKLTQPALTRIIKRLETQLGVPLFERHAGGMTLTEYGAALEPHASVLLAESDHAVRELDAMRGLQKGVVRVGSVSSAIESFLPLAVERLLAQWPGLQVSLVEGLSDELALWLAKGEIDLAICFSMPENEELALVSESEWQEGSHVVAAADHPLRRHASLRLADLAGQRWALPPRRMGPREEWQQLFIAQGLEPPPVAVEARSINALRPLVAGGGFLSWMPRLLLGESQGSRAIDVLPVEGAFSVRHFAVYRRRRGTLSPATAQMRDELRRQVQALPPAMPPRGLATDR